MLTHYCEQCDDEFEPVWNVRISPNGKCYDYFGCPFCGSPNIKPIEGEEDED